jgi:IS4 transposase
VRIIWVYRRKQRVELFAADLDFTAEQIIEFHGARWKIETGFKEIKQKIGSPINQTRKNSFYQCIIAHNCLLKHVRLS